MEKGPGYSAIFLLHFELPTSSVWSVLIFFGFKIGAVWGWWVGSGCREPLVVPSSTQKPWRS